MTNKLDELTALCEKASIFKFIDNTGENDDLVKFLDAAHKYMPKLLAIARAAQADMDMSHRMAWAMANNEEIEMSEPSVIAALAALRSVE